MIFHLGMPVVLFMSLLAKGQSETQWFPRHLKGADIRTVLMIQMTDEHHTGIGDVDTEQ